MSDKLFSWSVVADKTDVSIPVRLLSTAGAAVTGKVASDFTLSYLRQGGTRTAISASDLAAVNSAHSDGGVKEIDSSNMPSLYRVDLPDAAVASGADWVCIAAKVAGAIDYLVWLPIQSAGTVEIYSRIGAPAGASIAADIAALPVAVWAAATRTLTAISDSSGVTTLLTRIVGTLASGTHNAQSGDAYARLGAPAGASVSADIASVQTGITTLLSRISSTLFSGITYLSKWLGALAGKTADSSTLTEINATTAGATYNNTTDSLEAIKDAGTSASISEDDKADIAAAVWDNDAAPTRTLTQSAESVQDALAGGDISIRRGDYVSIALTGLGSLTGRSALYFTLKQNLQGEDSAALVQITEAAGLVVLNGSASGLTASDASLTVNNAAAGNVTIVLKANLTKQLAVMNGLKYDIQAIFATGPQTMTEGDAAVTADVTRAVS